MVSTDILSVVQMIIFNHLLMLIERPYNMKKIELVYLMFVSEKAKHLTYFKPS